MTGVTFATGTAHYSYKHGKVILYHNAERKKNIKCCFDCIHILNSDCNGVHRFFENKNSHSLIPQTMIAMILIVAGLLCFRLFFKSIDFFEKI